MLRTGVRRQPQERRSSGRRADVVRRVGTRRHGVHVRPPSGESARMTAIGRQPSVSGLNSGWPGNASRSIHRRATMRSVAVEAGDRRRLERPAPPSSGRRERRLRLGPGPAAVGRAPELDRQVVGVLAAADAVARRAAMPSASDDERPGTSRTPAASRHALVERSTISTGPHAGPPGRVDRQVDGLAAVRRARGPPRRPRPPPGRSRPRARPRRTVLDGLGELLRLLRRRPSAGSGCRRRR